MEDLSVSFIFGQAWDLTKKHMLPLALTVLVYVIIGSSLSLGAMSPNGFSQEALMRAAQDTHITANLISIVVALIFTVGFYTGCLRICRGQGSMSFSCFNRPFSVYLKVLCAQLLCYVICAVGFVLLIVPGIYFAVRFSQTTLFLIDNPELGIIEAFKNSWAATKGHVLELIGLGIIAIFVVILGYIACCIGVLVAIPVMNIAFTLVYLVLTSQLTVSVKEDSEQ